MRASASFSASGLLALGLLLSPLLAGAPARAAEPLDSSTRTECKGTRCVGSYCNQDGDALNCWQESVYRRKGDEEVVGLHEAATNAAGSSAPFRTPTTSGTC